MARGRIRSREQTRKEVSVEKDYDMETKRNSPEERTKSR